MGRTLEEVIAALSESHQAEIKARTKVLREEMADVLQGLSDAESGRTVPHDVALKTVLSELED